MIVLLRMKNSSAMPGFLSTSYMGEFVRDKAGKIELKNTCLVLEMLFRDQQGNQDLRTNYVTNSAVSNGVLKVEASEVYAARDVDGDDEIMKGYQEAMNALRLAKANLKHASQLPPQAGPVMVNSGARN